MPYSSNVQTRCGCTMREFNYKSWIIRLYFVFLGWIYNFNPNKKSEGIYHTAEMYKNIMVVPASVFLFLFLFNMRNGTSHNTIANTQQHLSAQYQDPTQKPSLF